MDIKTLEDKLSDSETSIAKSILSDILNPQSLDNPDRTKDTVLYGSVPNNIASYVLNSLPPEYTLSLSSKNDFDVSDGRYYLDYSVYLNSPPLI